MDTPFTPKTHISKRIKLWAIILLVAVILASGLAMLTGGKTRLFKGAMTGIDMKQKLVVEASTNVPSAKNVVQGGTVETMTFKYTVEGFDDEPNAEILFKKLVLKNAENENISKISLLLKEDNNAEIEKPYPLTDDDPLTLHKKGTITIKITLKNIGVAIVGDTFSIQTDFFNSEAKPKSWPSQSSGIPIQGENITSPTFTIVKPSLTVEYKKATGSPLSTIKLGEEKETMELTLSTTQTIIINNIFLTQEGTADLMTDIDTISASWGIDSANVHQNLIKSITPKAIDLTAESSGILLIDPNNPAKLTIKMTIAKKAEPGKTIKLILKENGIVTMPNTFSKDGLPIEDTTLFAITKEGTGPSFDLGSMADQLNKAAEEAAKAAGQTIPKLTIKIDPNTPEGQTVTSGDVDATKLLLTTNDEDVEIKTLTVTRGGITDTTSTEISSIDINGLGLFLYDEKDESLANSGSLTNLKSKLAYVFELNKYQPGKWIIPKNSTRKLTIRANVSKTAPEGNTFQLGILSKLAVVASTDNIWVGEGENPLTSSVMGNLFTIKAAGSPTPPAGAQLTVSKSADSPAGEEIKPGETNVEVAKFDLQATNQNLNIQKLNISAVDENNQLLSPQDIKSIIVWLESTPAKKTTIDLPGPYAAAGINIQPSFLIPQNTPQKLVIAVNTNATAVNGHKFKVGFVDTNGVTVEGGNPVTINQLKGNLFTIAVADPTKTSAGAQLTVSKTEIPTGTNTITAGFSADVLKLKFQAPVDANVTLNSIKFTIVGPAVLSDIQAIKLMDGTAVVGSSTDAVAFIKTSDTIYTTTITIATPLVLQANPPKELTLNITAKLGAKTGNTYSFRIDEPTDISDSTQNVSMTPSELLSSQLFTIATVVAGGTSTPTVSLTASPAISQTAGQQALFTVTVNNGPGGTYNYSIDFGNGTKQDSSSTLNTASFTSDYKAEAKDYTVTASVSQTVDGPLKTPLPATLTYKITTANTTLVTFENTCKSTPNAIWTPANNNCTLNGTIYNSETSFKTAIEAVATAQAKALADLQKQLADAQNAQSTAQIAALDKKIADLIALNAAEKEAAKSKASKELAEKAAADAAKKAAKKAKTPVETPAMWGTPAPVYVPPAPPAPSPEMISLQNQLAAMQQSAGQMYASAPSLGYSQKLVKAPDKSNTGPEVLVYFIAVGAANAAWWIRRKVRK